MHTTISTKTKQKRIVVFLSIFIFSLLPFIDITRPFSGIMLQKAMGREDLQFSQQLAHDDLLRSLVIVPEDITDTESVRGMVQRIDNIDRSVLALLVDQKVKVRLFDGKLTDEPLLYYLKWETPRGRTEGTTWEHIPGSGGSWLVSAKIGASAPGSGHGSVNLELHEIGHTVYRLLMTSPEYAIQINSAWKADVASMFPSKDYFRNYPSEYFAEIFAYYYLNDKTAALVKNKAHRTYAFFEALKNLEINIIEQHFFRK